eukprot:scaffold866_cov544-Prasinococcus_capsulatus_cf.AAC.11
MATHSAPENPVFTAGAWTCARTLSGPASATLNSKRPWEAASSSLTEGLEQFKRSTVSKMQSLRCAH